MKAWVGMTLIILATVRAISGEKARPYIVPEVQTEFVRLVGSAKTKDRIEAMDVLSLNPSNIDPKISLRGLATLLQDRSDRVRYAAAYAAGSSMFTITFFADDVSEVERLLRKMSSDERILNEQPIATGFSGPPWKIAMAAANGLCGIYERTKTPSAYKKWSRRFYVLAKEFLRRQGEHNEYYAVQMIYFSRDSVAESESLPLLTEIIQRNIKDEATIVLAFRRVEELVEKSALSEQSRIHFTRLRESAQKYLSDPREDVRVAASQFRRVINDRLSGKLPRKS